MALAFVRGSLLLLLWRARVCVCVFVWVFAFSLQEDKLIGMHGMINGRRPGSRAPRQWPMSVALVGFARRAHSASGRPLASSTSRIDTSRQQVAPAPNYCWR